MKKGSRIKVKIVTAHDEHKVLEEKINKFILDKNVVNISYSETWSDHYKDFVYGALIVYVDLR